MYTDNYARFRNGSPSVSAGGAPPSDGGSSSMAPPPLANGPRGLPMRGGYAVDPSMAMSMGADLPPEELVKSLQPIASTGRYVTRHTELPMNMAQDPRAGMNAPRGPPSGRPLQRGGDMGERKGGRGPERVPIGTNYEPMGGQSPSPNPNMNGYLPPVKYRRAAVELDNYGELRNSGGDGRGGSGGNGGEQRGPPINNRVPVNNYDLNEREISPATLGDSPPPQDRPQQQRYPQHRPQQHHQQQQQQRVAYPQFTPSSASPTPPRTQEEMIMIRQRLLEQRQRQQQQFQQQQQQHRRERYTVPVMEESSGYLQAAPPYQDPRNPLQAPLSNAAAAWARELEAFETPRSNLRDLLAPPSYQQLQGSGRGRGRGGGRHEGRGGRGQGGRGGDAMMTPQAMAQLRMRDLSQSMGDHVSSPGSRIVTPAATLHSSQRNHRLMARQSHAGIPSGPPQPRGVPTGTRMNELRGEGEGEEGRGGGRGRGEREKSMRPPYDQDMDQVAAAMMARSARNQQQRGMVPSGAGGGGGNRPASFPMRDYQALAMARESEVGLWSNAPPAPPDRRMAHAARASGPPSARGAVYQAEPYFDQDDGYAMPPAHVHSLLRAPQQLLQQQHQQRHGAPYPPPPSPLPPVSPPLEALAPLNQRRGSTKRKELEPSSKKQAKPAAKSASKSAKKTATSTATSQDRGGRGRGGGGEAAGGGGAGGGAVAVASEPKRRCGRKSMNYSSEQKRERNRAAVKKCRQRQALKYEYLQRKAEVLASENRALSEMLVTNVDLDDDKRNSLTRGIQMDILLKIKEIFTQSLPKDFVLNADSIWDLNSVLAVSMPSRSYYGIESIKDFWRTSLRMRNKGKIRSFWAWLFRLPPGDRFSQFRIEPFAATSNLYFINWTTKSTPPLSGSIVILFGHGHRVTLHVEIFGWLIWRYLLTNTPFPEPLLE